MLVTPSPISVVRTLRTHALILGVSASGIISVEASPDGTLYVPAFEVSANCAVTIIRYENNVPYFKVSYPGGGPLTTIIAVL